MTTCRCTVLIAALSQNDVASRRTWVRLGLTHCLRRSAIDLLDVTELREVKYDVPCVSGGDLVNSTVTHS